MNKTTFNIIVIITIAVGLTVLNQFELIDGLLKFALIPILAFYFLGQYAERKYGRQKES